MTRALCVVVVLSMTATASAKPLPPGWKVAVAKGSLVISRDGVSTTAGSGQINKLLKVGVSDDGTTIEATVEKCGTAKDMMDEPWTESVKIAPIEAKIENKLGMALHTKKKYAEAIAKFMLAAQKDPTTYLYATNLLSVQAMSGKLDDADKTIATYGTKGGRFWFAWRLAVDPELKALKERPSARLGAAKPGTAKGDLADKIAYSPLGYAATETTGTVYDGDSDPGSDSSLTIIDLATGHEVHSVPTVHNCAVSMETQKPDKACERKSAKANATARKAADAFLAQFGFEVLPNASTAQVGEALVATDGRKFVPGSPDKIVAGKVTKEIDVSKLWFVGFVPKAVVIGSMERDSGECGDGMGGSQVAFTVIATP